MKNYDELTNDLLERRDSYVAEQKRKRKTAMRVATSFCSICLVALIGFGVWNISNTQPTIVPDNSTNSVNDSVIKNDATKIPDNSMTDIPENDATKIIWADSANTDNEGIKEINGNSMSFGLYNAFEGATDTDVFAVLARPKAYYGFQYEGKSLEEYYLAMGNEKDLPDKLRQLSKEGDALKYGETLYTTGTPGGEKWAKELYEERIRFYGEDILNQYIIDGEFLKDKLEADIVKSENSNDATLAYKEAKNAYLTDLAQTIKGEFPTEVNIEQEALIMYMTRDTFYAFTEGSISEWIFGFASKNGNTDVLYGDAE